jgi:hypothetical protein
MRTVNHELNEDEIAVLADCVADYLKCSKEDAINHAKSWVNQFELEDRSTILTEISHIMTDHYFEKEWFERCLRKFIKDKDYWGDDIKTSLQKTKFVRYWKGNGQKALFGILSPLLIANHQLHSYECGSGAIERYVYLDDTLFTGGTALEGVTEWLVTAPSGASLDLFFFFSFQSGEALLKQQLKNLFAPKNIQFRIFHWKYYEDLMPAGKKIHRLYPTQDICTAVNEDYLNQIVDATADRTIMFRLGTQPDTETLFTSAEGRQVVEKAFLQRGADLLSHCNTVGAGMKPLGYGNDGTLGFGAMVFTYRNTPNNAPMVMWWGDPKQAASHPFSRWNPLLVRRIRGG